VLLQSGYRIVINTGDDVDKRYRICMCILIGGRQMHWPQDSMGAVERIVAAALLFQQTASFQFALRIAHSQGVPA